MLPNSVLLIPFIFSFGLIFFSVGLLVMNKTKHGKHT
jgi:hypothetical protein